MQESNYFVTGMGVFTTLTNMMLGAVVTMASIFGYTSAGSDHFRQHIILCTIGYALLFAQSILSLNKHTWTSSLNFYEKNTVHRIMAVIGAALAIAGSVIRIQGYGGTAFSTPHGILGWLALILTCVTMIVGASSFYVSKKVTKPLHIVVGLITYICAISCLCIGLDKTGFRSWISDGVATTLIIFTVISAIGVILSPVLGLTRRLVR